MIPSISSGGRTFKAAALYFLHDKQGVGQPGGLTAERVQWTATLNLPTDDPNRAWRMMVDTAGSQKELKEAAGIKATGRKLTRPTFAYSLAWHPTERPTQAEQMEAARTSLAALGLEDHQALIISHNDAAHPHIHILVNRVHPNTGVAAPLSRSKLKLSQWAQAYEEGRGKVFCPERVENNQRRYGRKHERASRNRVFRLTRAEWRAGIRDRKGVRACRREQAERFGAQAGRERQGGRRRREETDQHHRDRRDGREAIKARDRIARVLHRQPEATRARDRLADALEHGQLGPLFEALTVGRSTFTRNQMVRMVGQHTPDDAAFRAAMEKVEASPDLVPLGKDARGRERFTSQAHLSLEQRMERHARLLRGQTGIHRDVPAQWAGVKLSPDQAKALDHVLAAPRLAAVIGYAGTGKSTMLNAARESWEKAGYRVLGAALAGIAADGLKTGAGIDSRTIHSRLFQWDKGENLLTNRDILVVDEAGMIGSRQMERLLAHAAQAKAKVVLVGDYEQLQAIEAGGAFKAIVDRCGAAQINTVRRQTASWQKEATVELATGKTADALKRYEGEGRVHAHQEQDQAKAAIIAAWSDNRAMRPGQTQIILAFRNKDVRDLNQLARATLREQNALGRDVEFETGQGAQSFAANDRIYFLRNDAKLGVRNGSLGTIERISGQAITVKLDGDEGRAITFTMKEYSAITHGYAATIHKSQGVTVDRAHLLTTRNLDRHAAYVGMTRHRDQLDVHWSTEEMKNRNSLVRTLSREARKDTSLDYTRAAAEDRAARDQAAQDMRARVARRAANFAAREDTPQGRMANARSLIGQEAKPLEVARLALDTRRRSIMFRQQQQTLTRWARKLAGRGALTDDTARARPVSTRTAELRSQAGASRAAGLALHERHGTEIHAEQGSRRQLQAAAAQIWQQVRETPAQARPNLIEPARTFRAEFGGRPTPTGPKLER